MFREFMPGGREVRSHLARRVALQVVLVCVVLSSCGDSQERWQSDRMRGCAPEPTERYLYLEEKSRKRTLTRMESDEWNKVSEHYIRKLLQACDLSRSE